MKNILTVLLLFATISLYAQKEYAWFDAGLKGMYGGSTLLNSAVSDAKSLDYELVFSNSYGLGGKFGINRGNNGLTLELFYKKGNAAIQNLTEGESDLDINWTALELYTLFRNNANLGFFEIGPKFSLLNAMDRKNGVGTLRDLKEDQLTNDLGISAVLSFGALILGNDRGFSGQLGLRLEYGFLDMIKDGAGQTSFEPFPDLADENVAYSKSTPIFVGLVFELNWGLGFYGVSQCGGRPKLFSF